jgi:capsule polysaccharide export protein KpsE/RkpR
MENFFSSKSLLSLFYKWKWHLLIVAAAAALISFIITSPWIVKPKFKAVSVVYPSNIAPYSDESETEQMLQWINSKDVRDSVIRTLNLDKYYGIDSSYEYYASTMSYLYDKNVKINKTQFESIEITVYDWDKEFAKKISNSIFIAVDNKIRSIHTEKYDEVAASYKKFLDAKKKEIDSVKSLARELSAKSGIYSVIGQSEEITRGVLRTVDGGGGSINNGEVQRLKAGMEQNGGDLLFLNYRIQGLAIEYSEMVQKYDQAVFDANKKYTFLNIVTPPQVGDKPAYPKKLFTMVYFVLTALLLTVIAIAIIEKRKSFTNK